ncbi:(deoxy)nucleoside triphosphate pyrophosphohydrolase [Candidatus Pseudothioglobus sp. Uisw_041]|jgi:8-oxo-dGTP diphosphatase|uniref:(deoxy)nucleoside triphosphate pyrophosphohydrolase n=1 Tax=unclassified Candidatus Pseudothioglobus TaxID=3072908 RepID=UPI003A86D3D0|tara:strand:+ start:135 stop:512 length:378 start_codon:yes stop_codon:yes gene_type:complete
MKVTDVVAAIIKKDNLYLVTQRNRNKHMGLKWEFPGGKVEANEALKEALAREIYEELNIDINVYEKLAEESYKDSEINIVLHYFLCTIKDGVINLNEHEAMEWIDKTDFDKYDFVEGDGNITSLI